MFQKSIRLYRRNKLRVAKTVQIHQATMYRRFMLDQRIASLSEENNVATLEDFPHISVLLSALVRYKIKPLLVRYVLKKEHTVCIQDVRSSYEIFTSIIIYILPGIQ